jgi:hypothetical protein
MQPSCIDLYVFAGQSNVLGWGVGPLEMQRVLSAHRRLAGGAPVLLFEPLGAGCSTWAPYSHGAETAASCRTDGLDAAERASLRLRTASGAALDAVAALRLAARRGAGRASCAVGVVKLGMGSTSMEQWHPEFPASLLRAAGGDVAARPPAWRAAVCLACTPLLAPPGAAGSVGVRDASCGAAAPTRRLTHSAATCAAAVNSTPLWRYDRAPQRWSTPRRATTNLYTALVGKVARASASARARFGRVRFGGFVWFQGENELNGLQPLLSERDDRGVSLEVRRWPSTLARIVAGVRSAAADPRLRVLVLRTRWQRAARRQRDAQAVLSDLAAQCRAHAASTAHTLQFSAFAMAGRRRNATGGGRNRTVTAADCAAAVDALELRRSQMEVAAHVDGAEWVDTDGATYRNIHLAAQGHFELGVAVAERLSKIT